MAKESPVVRDYEVFRNDKNALAFFFYQHEELDQNGTEGPFWFSVQDGTIRAGTEAHHVVFADVEGDIITTARQRGVIMMMEFEGQTPVRCTPCYLSESF